MSEVLYVCLCVCVCLGHPISGGLLVCVIQCTDSGMLCVCISKQTTHVCCLYCLGCVCVSVLV